MYDHERSLVKKYSGRPFAIVGVNTDTLSAGEIAELKQKKNITWRSFLEGSRQGPIVREWPIVAFPAIYLIDDRGVIRAINKKGTALESILDQLVDEAEQRAGN